MEAVIITQLGDPLPRGVFAVFALPGYGIGPANVENLAAGVLDVF